MKTEKPRTFSNGNQNGRQIHELHSSKERSLLGKTSKPYETFISKPETERIFQHKTTFVFHKKRKTEDNPFLLKKKHYTFQSKPKYSLHHYKTEMPLMLTAGLFTFPNKSKMNRCFYF